MLNHNDINTVAPSVFALNPHPRVSAKYQFVPTANVLSAFEADGFVCINAKQQKVRDISRKETTKHTLLLRHKDIEGVEVRGKNIPTVRLTNSHDWSSTFQVSFGMLALMCSNGLYFAGPQYASYTIRHDTVMEDVQSIVARFRSTVAKMNETIETWSGIQLPTDSKRDFARRAAEIRFGTEKASFEIADVLLATRRREDEANDLWTVFNTVQENVIKGGVKAGKRRSRTVKNIEAEREMNEKIFELALSYA